MDTIKMNFKEIYSINDKNWSNSKNNGFQQKSNNMNNKINKYPNPTILYPLNIVSNFVNNNVHLNNDKKNLENKQNINNINILNDQNINILNLDLIPKNTSHTPKIIIQKSPNKEKRSRNFFHQILTENNLANNNLNEIQENKETKSNYQYIIKNVKK